MKKKLQKINLKQIIIFSILLVAFLFRFYRLSSWFSFGMDQEYEAFIAKNIVSGRHFPLIGVNASDTGLYLGPVFVYLASIPYALFSGNPLGWAIAASFLGVVTCYLVYRVGKELFSDKTGIFAGFLYASSFMASFYDRKFWNPSPVPIISLLIGLFLYRITRKKYHYLPWLILVFSIGFQSHLSMLVFAPLIIYIIWKHRKHYKPKILWLSLAIFILLQLPLILFDLRHNFVNLKAAVNLMTGNNQVATAYSTLPERGSIFLNALGRFFWLPAYPDIFVEGGQCSELTAFIKNAYPEIKILVLVGIAIFLLSFIKFAKSKARLQINDDYTDGAKRIVMSIFALAIFVVLFYQRSFYEYYLLFLIPYLAIVLGKSLDYIWSQEHGSSIVFFLIGLFTLLNLVTLFTATASYSYTDKLQALKFSKPYLSGESYSLEALGECSRFGGYRYMYEHFAAIPVSSYMDSYFAWLYPYSIKKQPESIVVLLSLIDPRIRGSDIAKWQEVKLRFLSEFNIVDSKKLQKLQVYILAPKT